MLANESTVLEFVLSNVVKLPGVKVDRREFFEKSFSKHLSPDELAELIEKGAGLANIDKQCRKCERRFNNVFRCHVWRWRSNSHNQSFIITVGEISVKEDLEQSFNEDYLLSDH